MKLITTPIKILLSIIGILILIPLIVIGLLWRSVSPPDNYHEQTISVENTITESIDTFMEEDGERKPLTLGLNAQIINNEIRSQLIEQSNSYNEEYVIQEGMVFIQGAWVSMKEDTVDITLGIHVDTPIILFKSRVLLRFEIVDTDGVIELKLKKITIGNLPLAWMSGFANQIFKRVMNQDLESMVQEQIGDYGEFNLKKRTLTIDLRNAAANLEDNKDLAVALVDLIYSEELFELGIKESGAEYRLGIQLGLNELEDKTPRKEVLEPDRINSDPELEIFLKSKLDIDETKLIETMLATNPQFRLTNYDINIVLDYMIRTSLPEAVDSLIQQITLYEGYDVKIYLPYLHIDNSLGEVNLPMELVTDSGDAFMTTIKLKTSINITDDDLILGINSVTIGNLSLNNELIEEFMELMPGSDEMMVGTTFVIEDFTANFDQPGLEFTNLTFEGSDIVLTYNVPVMDDALEEVLNDPNISNDTKDLINDVILDPSNEHSINDLINHIETLDEAERDALFDAISNAIANMNP